MLYKTATLLHTKNPKDLQLLGMGVEREHRYKFKIDTKDTTQEHRSISDLIVYSQHSSTTTVLLPEYLSLKTFKSPDWLFLSISLNSDEENSSINGRLVEKVL